MSENLAVVILGVVGVVIQLVFKFMPVVKQWYEKQVNKGPIMLAVVAVVSVIYFGLSCTSLGAEFGVTVSCTQAGVVALAKAIFLIASGNQLTYLYIRNVGKV